MSLNSRIAMSAHTRKTIRDNAHREAYQAYVDRMYRQGYRQPAVRDVSLIETAITLLAGLAIGGVVLFHIFQWVMS